MFLLKTEYRIRCIPTHRSQSLFLFSMLLRLTPELPSRLCLLCSHVHCSIALLLEILLSQWLAASRQRQQSAISAFRSPVCSRFECPELIRITNDWYKVRGFVSLPCIQYSKSFSTGLIGLVFHLGKTFPLNRQAKKKIGKPPPNGDYFAQAKY